MASVTPLVSLLKFKSLNARLMDTEFDTFMSKMWRIVGREEILKLLCTPCLKESDIAPLVNEGGPNLLNTMTTITSDIIQDRDRNSNPRTKPNINNMPSCLVGTIASFLTQSHYIRFSRTNRKVYVDCNSPNSLQKLTLLQVTDYSTVPLKQFPQIKCLKFNLKQITGFKEIDGQRFGDCNQLKTLIIDGNDSTNSDVNLFINDSSRCFSSIETLTLARFTKSSKLQPDAVLRILSKFGKLVHFQMYAAQSEAPLSSHALSLVCPEIQEFTSIASSHCEHVLEAWKGRIETLTIGGPTDDISTYDISAVKRLCVLALKIPKIYLLLNSSKSIREISWIPNTNTPPRPPLKGQQIAYIIKKCIVDQVSLEYLYVSTRGHFESICSGIHFGLYLTKKQKRKQFEIALNVDVREISKAEEFVCCISKIINVIRVSNIEDWMICVDAHRGSMGQQYFNWKQMKVALTDLLRSLQMKVKLVKVTQTRFALGENPNMKRHSMWWRTDDLFGYY